MYHPGIKLQGFWRRLKIEQNVRNARNRGHGGAISCLNQRKQPNYGVQLHFELYLQLAKVGQHCSFLASCTTPGFFPISIEKRYVAVPKQSFVPTHTKVELPLSNFMLEMFLGVRQLVRLYDHPRFNCIWPFQSRFASRSQTIASAFTRALLERYLGYSTPYCYLGKTHYSNIYFYLSKYFEFQIQS